MSKLTDKKIIDSWSKNVEAWTKAVRDREIPSRKLVTDKAILEATLDTSPKTAIDIGCGEGWLVRELVKSGVRTLGTDVVTGLIEEARSFGEGEYEVLSYEDFSSKTFQDTFDTAVCNFSLLGEESVPLLFKALPKVLSPKGHLVIQTLHPLMACGEEEYVDGWREGSWDGFDSRFVDPAPWYFRKLESWVKLYTDHGFALNELREPLHPDTNRPASVIFIGRVL